MGVLWGVVVLALALLAWGGQTIAWLAPETAGRFGLIETESEVEPTYWADIRGEAAWDALTLWTLVVAGVLLVLDDPAWPYFGLVGGGTYVYFAGRAVFTRSAMLRRGLRVGATGEVRLAYGFSVVWGSMALATIAASVVALRAS